MNSPALESEQKVHPHDLPVMDPKRMAYVLNYIEGGAGWGIGGFEWDTIKEALRWCSQQGSPNSAHSALPNATGER